MSALTLENGTETFATQDLTTARNLTPGEIPIDTDLRALLAELPPQALLKEISNSARKSAESLPLVSATQDVETLNAATHGLKTTLGCGNHPLPSAAACQRATTESLSL